MSKEGDYLCIGRINKTRFVQSTFALGARASCFDGWRYAGQKTGKLSHAEKTWLRRIWMSEKLDISGLWNI